MKLFPSLNIIDNITVKEPCQEAWEGMAGDDKKRHCERCAHSVVNLSALTRVQAARLVSAEQEKGLCIHFERNSAGSIRFRPSWFERRSVQVGRALTVLAACFGLLGLNSNARAEEQSKGCPAAQHSTRGKLLVVKPSPTSSPVPESSSEPDRGPRNETLGRIALPKNSQQEKVPEPLTGLLEKVD